MSGDLVRRVKLKEKGVISLIDQSVSLQYIMSSVPWGIQT